MRSLLARHGLDEGNIEVVHNGIDLDRYSPGTTSGKKRVLFLSNLEPYKGYTHFASMAKAVSPSRKDVEFAATHLDANDDRVIALGYLDEDDVVRELQRAFAVVIPSLWEEPGTLLAVEAMACGKPVLAYGSGSLPELIEDGKTGILVPRGSLDDLIASTAYLLENEDVAEAMGKCGRARAIKEFSLSTMARKYDEIISRASGH